MPKGIIVDVGFKADIQDLLNNIEQDFRKVDFGDAIGLSDAFDKQEKEVRQKLKELSKIIDETINGKIPNDPNKQLQALNKAVGVLSSTMKDLIKSMPASEMGKFSGSLNNITGAVEELSGVCGNAVRSVEVLQEVTSDGIQFVDKTQKKELENIYKLLERAREASEQASRPRKQKGDTPYSDTDAILTDLYATYNIYTEALKEADAIMDSSTLTDKEKTVQLDKLNASLMHTVTNMSRMIATFMEFDDKWSNTKLYSGSKITLGDLEQSLGAEIDELLDYISNRKAEISKAYYELGGTDEDLQNLFKKGEKKNKNGSITVPMEISTRPNSLINQALEIIEQIQSGIAEHPLQVEVQLISVYRSNKNQEILKQVVAGLDKIEDEEVRQKLIKYIDDMQKGIDNALLFNVKVNTESAFLAIRRFITDAKTELKTLSEELIPLEPEVVLTDAHKQAFQKQLDEAKGDFTINVGIMDGDNTVDQNATKKELSYLKLLRERVESVEEAVNNKTLAFIEEEHYVEDSVRNERQYLNQLLGDLIIIEEEIKDIALALKNIPTDLDITVNKDSFDAIDALANSDVLKKIADAKTLISSALGSGLGNSIEIPDDAKIKLMADVDDLSVEIRKMLDVGVIQNWSNEFLYALSEIGERFQELFGNNALNDWIQDMHFSDEMMLEHLEQEDVKERSAIIDDLGKIYGSGAYDKHTSTRFPHYTALKLKNQGINPKIGIHSHGSDRIGAASLSQFDNGEFNGDLIAWYQQFLFDGLEKQLIISLKDIQLFNAKGFFEANPNIKFDDENLMKAVAEKASEFYQSVSQHFYQFIEDFVSFYGTENGNGLKDEVFKNIYETPDNSALRKAIENAINPTELLQNFFKYSKTGTGTLGSILRRAFRNTLDFSTIDYSSLGYSKEEATAVYEDFCSTVNRYAEFIVNKAFGLSGFSLSLGNRDIESFNIRQITPKILEEALAGTGYKNNYQDFIQTFTTEEFLKKNPLGMSSSVLSDLFNSAAPATFLGTLDKIVEDLTTIKSLAAGEALQGAFNVNIDNVTLKYFVDQINRLIESIEKLPEKITEAFSSFEGVKTKSPIDDIDKQIQSLNDELEKTSEEIKEIEEQINNVKPPITSGSPQSPVSGNQIEVLSYTDPFNEMGKYKKISESTVDVLVDIGKSEDEILSKLKAEKELAEANNEIWKERLILLDSAGKVVASHRGSTDPVTGINGVARLSQEELDKAKGGKIIHTHPNKASFFSPSDYKDMIIDGMSEQIKTVELMWKDSTLSVDKTSMTKQTSSTLYNIIRNVSKTLTDLYTDNPGGTPSLEAREHINAIQKEIFKVVAQKLNISVTETGSQAQEVTDALSDVDKAIIQRFKDIKSNIIQDVNPSEIISNQTPLLNGSTSESSVTLTESSILQEQLNKLKEKQALLIKQIDILKEQKRLLESQSDEGTSSIDDKTRAFQTEGSIVNSVIDDEIEKLKQFEKQLGKIITAVNLKTEAFKNEGKTIEEVVDNEIQDLNPLQNLESFYNIFKPFYDSGDLESEEGAKAALSYYNAYKQALESKVNKKDLKSYTLGKESDLFTGNYANFKKGTGELDFTGINSEIEKFQEIVDKFNQPEVVNLINAITEAIQKLLDAGTGSEKAIKLLENLNKTIVSLSGKSGETKIAKIVENFEKFQVAINGLDISDNGFIKSLSSILEKGNELKVLGEILKSTKKQIDAASKAVQEDNNLSKAQDILGKYETEMLQTVEKKHIDADETVLYTQLEATKDGLVQIITLIQDADDKYKRFIHTTSDGINIKTKEVKQGDDPTLDKYIKQWETYKRLKEASTGLGNLGKDEETFTPDSAGWDKLVDKAAEFGIELKDIVKIVRNIDRAGQESFQIFTKLSRVTVGMDSNKVLFRYDDVLNKNIVNELENDIISLNNKISKAFKGDGLSAQSFINELEKVAKKWRELDHLMTRGIIDQEVYDQAKSYLNIFQNIFGVNDIENLGKGKSPQFLQKLDEAKVALDEVHLILGKIAKDEPFSEEDISRVKEFIRSMQELTSTANDKSSKLGNTVTIDKLLKKIEIALKKNTAMSKELKYEFLDLQKRMKSAGDSIPADEMARFGAETERLLRKMEEGKTGLSFFDSLKKRVVSMSKSAISMYFSLYDILRYVRTGYETIKELDTALTEMRKVSDESIASLKKYQATTFDIAKDIGATAVKLQNSAADFMRIGESLTEAAESAQSANILFNISEFQDINEATESLVSMSAAFKELEKGEIVDVVNELGNNYAISTDGLATALQNSASALRTAQNDFYESAALTTAANTVVQDPDKVGAGLRTIALRLTGTEAAKAELEELGEDISDFQVTTTSKMDESIKMLTKTQTQAGVSLLDMNGNYRSTYDILLDIAKVWEEIAQEDLVTGENRQNALLEMMAGKNRSNILASILQSPEVLEEAYKSALNAEGSAQEELDKYLDSIEGRTSQLTTQFQEFWSTVIDSELIKEGISLLTELLELVTDLVNNFGILGFAGFGAAGVLGAQGKGFVNYDSDAGQWVNNIAKLFSGGKTSKGTQSFVDRILELSNTKDISKVDITGVADKITKKFGEIDQSVLKAAETLKTKGAAGLDDFKKAADNAGKGSAKFAASLKTITANVGIMIALEVAVWAVSKAVDALVVTVEEQREKVEQLKSNYEDLNSEYDELIKKQKDLGDDGLTQYENDRLDYLKERLELDKQILEAETRILNQKETGQKGIFHSITSFFDSDSVDNTYIKEFGLTQGKTLGDYILKGILASTPLLSLLESYLDLSGHDALVSEGESLLKTHEEYANRLNNLKAQKEAALLAGDTDQVEYIEQFLMAPDQKLMNENADELKNYYDKLLSQEGDYLTAMAAYQASIDSGISGEALDVTTEKLDTVTSAYNALLVQKEQVEKAIGAYDDFAELEGQEFFDKEEIIALISSEDDLDKITATLTKDHADLIKYLNKEGISVEALVKHYKELATTVEEHKFEPFTKSQMINTINSMSDGFSVLDDIYADVFDKKAFDYTKLDTKKFEEAFKGLGTEYTEFIESVSSTPNDIEACQDAFNKLVTAFIRQKEILKNITEENAKVTIAMLTNMGIANATEIVEHQLELQRERLALQTEELNNATYEEVIAMFNAAEADSVAQQALAELALTKITVNTENIDTIEDIEQIIGLANTANATTASLERLLEAKKLLEQATDVSDDPFSSHLADYYRNQAQELLSQPLEYDEVDYEQFIVSYTGADATEKAKDSVEDSKKYFDWIETALSRIQRTITNLGNTVSATYKKWSTRNNALAQELGVVNQEIALQQAAYDAYISKANSIGLPEEYKKLIQSGGLDISVLNSNTDKVLIEQIETYTDWYEKALACADAVEELRANLAELARTKFDNIASEFAGRIGLIEHNISMMDGYVSQAETAGYIAGEKYYESMLQYQMQNIGELRNKYSELVNALNSSVENGSIEYMSQEWMDMYSQINDVESALQEANTALIEYSNSLRQLNWDIFDRLQKYISDITAEAEFLIDLLDNDKLFDEHGNMTKHGLSAQGLHAMNYNSYMEQADRYAEEILNINKQLAQDPNNITLLDRRTELLEAQRASILNAESEKEAIVDLVEEGYNIMLDSLQELIDKRKEELDLQQEAYQYQKDIEEKTKNIASLRKQLMAYEGDNSEEAKATIQQLKVSLSDAEEELEQTEYEKYLSDQQQMLDNLYSQSEQWVNERLDNIDGLISEAIEATNQSADSINSTLENVSSSVGYTLTEEMQNIWDNESVAFDGVGNIVAQYGDVLNGTLTSVKEVLDSLNVNTVNLGEIMENRFVTSSSSSAPVNDPSGAGNGSQGTGTQGNSSFVEKNYYTVLDNDTRKTLYTGSKSECDSWIKNNHYKVVTSGGYTIIVRPYKYIVTDKRTQKPIQSDLNFQQAYGMTQANSNWRMSAYGSGTRNALPGWHVIAEKGDELVETNEGVITLASGAQLFPFKGGETVYDAAETQKLLSSSINPMTIADVLKKNVSVNTPTPISHGNVNNDISITLTLPGVTNYEEFVSKLKSDKQFEKFMQSVTIDQALGGNSLSKNKYK